MLNINVQASKIVLDRNALSWIRCIAIFQKAIQ